MEPARSRGRLAARCRIHAERIVVRTFVGALVGALLLVPTMLLLWVCGIPPSRLGVASLLAFLAGGAMLMNAFPRTRPARFAVRFTRWLEAFAENVSFA